MSSSTSTQTCAIELRPIGESSDTQVQSKPNNDPSEFLPQPSTTVTAKERWNHPKVNMWRTFATFFAFILMGANDAAYGVMIPYVRNFQPSTCIIIADPTRSKNITISPTSSSP